MREMVIAKVYFCSSLYIRGGTMWVQKMFPRYIGCWNFDQESWIENIMYRSVNNIQCFDIYMLSLFAIETEGKIPTIAEDKRA